MTQERWLTVDFKPAPPGYRLVYIDADEDPIRVTIKPMPGWLIEEKQVGTDWDGLQSTGERRVVAAEHGEWDREIDVAWPDILWRVLAPGEADPTEDEIAEAKKTALHREQARRDQAATKR